MVNLSRLEEVKKNESVNVTQQQRYDYWLDYSIGSSECYISVSQIRNRSEINAALYIPNNKQLYWSFLHKDRFTKRH